jgi:hypothetical protein
LKVYNSSLDSLKSSLGRKGNSKDRSLASNVLKALLARKRQFEGPKSYLEYLEGATSPKVRFEGPKSYLEYLEGAAGPKKTIRIQFRSKIPSKEQLFSERQSHRKTLRIFGWHKREEQKGPRRRPSREVVRVQGVHTFEARKIFRQSLPFEPKRINLPKGTRHR